MRRAGELCWSRVIEELGVMRVAGSRVSRLATRVLAIFLALAVVAAALAIDSARAEGSLARLESRVAEELSSREPPLEELAYLALALAARDRLVLLDVVAGVSPRSLAVLRYPCPAGITLRVESEPPLELVTHARAEHGVCETTLRNPRLEPVSSRVVVYAERPELAGDEAFKVYAVITWVYGNIRYSASHQTSPTCSPTETLKRGSGNCCELATAAASLLRKLGIEAGVAIITPWKPTLTAWHAAIAIKPTTPNFLDNLMTYYGTPTTLCPPITTKGYIILDPLLAASSTTPWCTPYTNEHIHTIITPEEIQKNTR